MSKVLLSLRGVSKSYPSLEDTGGHVRALGSILLHGKIPANKPVLEGLDLQVVQGESIAIIGGNGAGKSTLLKLITGVLTPSTGEIKTIGSTAALLELGAGFDPEYTGLENLKMNAAFLGLSRSEIEKSLDAILTFADIGEAINQPVKHYSSGMIVRLGFAIVTAVKPELLITDEVLAVGDESFQKKCIRWIEQYLSTGGTLLMVSHNMYQVQKLCQKAIWLDQGVIRRYGDVFDVTQRYLAWHESKDRRVVADEASDAELSKKMLIDLKLNGQDPEIELSIQMGQDLQVSVRINSLDGRVPVLLIGLVRADGTPIYGVATDHDGYTPNLSEDGSASIVCHFPSLALLPGSYQIRAHVLDPEGLRVHETEERNFLVSGETRELGMVHLQHKWSSE